MRWAGFNMQIPTMFNERPVMKIMLSVVALLAMTVGSAMAQQRGVPPEQMPEDRRSDTIVRLIGIEAVQTDLGVGDDLARKMTRLSNSYRDATVEESEKAGLQPVPGTFGFSQRLTPEQSQKLTEIKEKLYSEFAPKATELLSADQVKRIHQIQIQGRLQSGPRALFAPALASELKLTDDQRESINALIADMRGKQFPGGAGIRSGPGTMEGIRKVAREYSGKAVEVLTAEQKEALSKLKGKEFDVSKLPQN
jgi:hypothetical protein